LGLPPAFASNDRAELQEYRKAAGEPVAWLWTHPEGESDVSLLHPDDDDDSEDAILSDWSYQPLYATPQPAPAVEAVPDAIHSQGDTNIQDDYFALGWNACRAAMQQPVSNRDELPLDYLQGHKDGLAWAAQLAEANHPQTGDWLYDDPVALAAAIRKGPDMPEFKSVSVDGDDNFYSWFGRFWYENYQQNNYTASAKQMLGTMAEFAYRAGRESAARAGNSPATPDGWKLVPLEPTEEMMAEAKRWTGLTSTAEIVYREMLAASPQQE
jgi:hypothetical protein